MALFEEYLRHLRLERKATNTVETYRYHLTAFLSWAYNENYDLKNLKPMDLLDFKECLLMQNKSERTVNAIISCLKGYFDYLVLYEVVKTNPITNLLRIKVPHYKQDRLTDRQLVHFYASLGGFISMKKKDLKLERMWSYFIDATEELIKTEGLQNVTIRSVANKAGFNSATIYNYFSEFSHLIFFASLKFLDPYTKKVTSEMQKETNPLRKYIVAWECFSEYSFKNPDIFYAVFLQDLGEHPEELFNHYYELYPSHLLNIPEDLQPILLERSISSRGRYAINQMVEAGILDHDKADYLNELTNVVWQGMFYNLLNNRTFLTPEEAHERTMMYIKDIIYGMVNTQPGDDFRN